jgi:hypothetical protein
MKNKDLSIFFALWVNSFFILNIAFELLSIKMILSILASGVVMTAIMYFFIKKNKE